MLGYLVFQDRRREQLILDVINITRADLSIVNTQGKPLVEELEPGGRAIPTQKLLISDTMPTRHFNQKPTTHKPVVNLGCQFRGAYFPNHLPPSSPFLLPLFFIHGGKMFGGSSIGCVEVGGLVVWSPRAPLDLPLNAMHQVFPGHRSIINSINSLLMFLSPGCAGERAGGETDGGKSCSTLMKTWRL